MKRGKAITSFLIVAIMAILSVLPKPVQAIPSFTRVNNIPCAVCHSGFPKLNSFGIEFKQGGYRMPGQEGKFFWEQPVPLAGQIGFSYQYQKDEWNPEITGTPNLVNSKKSRFGLDGWQLFMGGTLAPQISFLGMIIGDIPGLGPGASPDPSTGMIDTDKTDIETEVFLLQLDDLVPNQILNLRIGKYQVDNYFLSTPRRLTQANYLIQIQPMLGPSIHPMSVGAEFNGYLPVGLRYAAGIRNYGASYTSKTNDDQRVGAFYAWVNQAIMGQTVSILFNDDRVGNAQTNTDDTGLGYGLSLDLHLGALNIIPGLFRYQEGGRAHSGTELKTTSGTVEAIYPFSLSLLGIARYDFNKRDDITANAKQYVASIVWYQLQNVRWVLEYNRLITSNLVPAGTADTLILMDTGTVTSDLTQDKAALFIQASF